MSPVTMKDVTAVVKRLENPTSLTYGVEQVFDSDLNHAIRLWITDC